MGLLLNGRSSADSDSESSDDEESGRSVSFRAGDPKNDAWVGVKSASPLLKSQSPVMVGETCEVRSVSQNKWLTATVTKVDSQAKTVSVEYETSKGRMTKLLQYNSEDLRKLEGTPVRDGIYSFCVATYSCIDAAIRNCM